jgi:hypothetical protein
LWERPSVSISCVRPRHYVTARSFAAGSRQNFAKWSRWEPAAYWLHASVACFMILVSLCRKAHTLHERSGPLSLAGGRGLSAGGTRVLVPGLSTYGQSTSRHRPELRCRRLADRRLEHGRMFGPSVALSHCNGGTVDEDVALAQHLYERVLDELAGSASGDERRNLPLPRSLIASRLYTASRYRVSASAEQSVLTRTVERNFRLTEIGFSAFPRPAVPSAASHLGERAPTALSFQGSRAWPSFP